MENNRSIAEFMGLTIITDNISYFDTDYKPMKSYQSDWKALIPVIEKCREKQLFGSQRLISNIDMRLLKLDILATYQNVIEFINWYNSQTK